MANITISDLNSKTQVTNSDVMMVEESGVETRKITVEVLLSECSKEGHTHNYNELEGTPPEVDLSEYATQDYVTTAINQAQLNGDVDIDLSDYALKSELFSGSYNDLTNKPTIPSATSQLVNDSSYATTTYVDSKVDGITSSGGSEGSGVSSLSLGIVNVKDYGAVGDGVTDDSQAIKNAIVYMCSFAEQCSSDLGWKSYMPTLYFPHGKYLVAQKGTLNCVGTALQGYNIKGAGYLNTEILYTYDSASDPDGGYLLVNGDDNWFAFSYMEDITFRGNGTNNIWQIKSRDGCPQANRFRRVGFYNVNRCVTVSFGTYNYCADLFRFESCKASQINGWVFGAETNQNSQTVVHTFRDCDFEDINGYGIYLKSGGTIEVRGGSWIMGQTGRAFHFDDTSGAGIGVTNRNISIYGTKFEYQYYDTSDTNLDYYPLFYNDSRMVIYFHGCNFAQFSYAGNSNIANYGYLGIMGTVFFKDCHIPACFGIKTNPTLSVGMDNVDQKPIVKFTDCILYNPLDKIVSQVSSNYYQGGAYTDAIAEGCYSTNTTGNVHVNTQLNQTFGNRTVPTGKKMVILTNGTNPITSLPCDGAYFSYKIPQGAIITTITIYFRYAANGDSFTVKVTNPSGDVLATATHTPNTGAKAYTTDVFIPVEPIEGATSIDYYLTVTGVGYNVNGGLAGFVAVEYY